MWHGVLVGEEIQCRESMACSGDSNKGCAEAPMHEETGGVTEECEVVSAAPWNPYGM